MRTKLIAIAVASLFANGAAWAQYDSFVWSGSAEAGGRGVNTDGGTRNGAFGLYPGAAVQPFTGPADEAKANEYQNLDNGVIGILDVRGSSKNYYMKFFGENFGRDDQYVEARGGGYDVFKAIVYQDRMPHNLSWNALTPLWNSWSNLQQGPAGTYPPARDPSTWNTFDYGLQRNTTGGAVEISARSPFFFRADYNEVETTGSRPQSGQLGTGSGNGLIEFGAPVEYKTKNALFEGGYTARAWNVKIAYLDSKFSNSIDTMQWTNFYMRSALDTSLLPPDNELKKWSIHATARELPLDSTFLLRASQSKLTNNVDLGDGSVANPWNSALKPVSSSNVPANQQPVGVGYLITAPSSSTFDGEEKTTSVQASLTSTLTKGLESRIYYNYYDKENNSTEINYAAGGLGPDAANCPNPGSGIQSSNATRFCIPVVLSPGLFGYTKDEAGVDLIYRLGTRQKLVGNYTWLKVDRELEPAPSTTDHRFWIEYRNSMWEGLSGRLKYQYLTQSSDIDHSFTNNSSGQTPAQVPYYFSAYDIADYDQNMVKLVVDWNPAPLLDIGFGATWRKTDYKDLYYGRTDDKRQIYDVSIGYGDPGKLRVSAIGNWGRTEFDQAYRNVGSATASPPNNLGPLPSDPTNSANFNWGTKNTQDNWLVALQADWAASEKLQVTAQASWLDTGGGVDFWSADTTGAGGYQGGPLVNYVTDDTQTTRFLIKANYRFDRKWAATVGYAYEKYDYSDGQMAGYQGYYPYYQYIPGNNNAVSSNSSWFTGAYGNPSYKNNIVWLTVTYKFDTPLPPPAKMAVAEAPPRPVVAPPPPPTPPPAPAPAPAPAPQVQKVTLDSKVLFDFNKAVLKPEGRAAIDSQVIGKLAQIQKLDVVIVTGHTDRIGSEAANQKLSEERAKAVGDYLGSKGVDKTKIRTIGMGEKQPVAQCDQKDMKALIACLQPNRRVDVEVRGETTKR